MLNPNATSNIKRTNQREEVGYLSNPSSHREGADDKLNISPNESDEEQRSALKKMGNTLGFFPMNNLTKANKGVHQSEVKSQRFGKISGQLSSRYKESQTTDKKNDKNKKSTFQKDKLFKASRSIDSVGEYPEAIDDKLKDKMILKGITGNDQSWTVAQEWQNDKDITSLQNADNFSKRGRKNKTSRIGSREGSKKSKRHKKIISSVQSKRGKYNKSRQGGKRVLHKAKELVVFNEFKTEDKVNKEIGIDKEEELKGNILEGIYAMEMRVDGSQLNEAISINYTLGDRS
jgi:hypothetical protein